MKWAWTIFLAHKPWWLFLCET